MNRLIIMFMFLVSLAGASYADTVTSVTPGAEDGSVAKSWVVDVLQKGNVTNVVFIDARPNSFYEKQHSDKIAHLDPDMFYEDGGCQKALSMIPKDKIVVLICPGPRARESYHNLTDPVKDGGCGYNGGNVYWIHTPVVFDSNGVEVK